MGHCCSPQQAPNDAQKANDDKKSVKMILLLGSKHAGKSTVLKSIRRLGQGSVPGRTLTTATPLIRQNIVSGILTLLKKSQELYDEYDDANYLLPLMHDDGSKNDELIEKIQLIANYTEEAFEEETELNYNELASLADAIYEIWTMPQIQCTFASRTKARYVYTSNLDYFLAKTRKCFAQYYRPTEEDYFKLRKFTPTGRFGYSLHPLLLQMNDATQWRIQVAFVGNNYRRRLLGVLSEEACCVLFVCALDQFCEVLTEDENKNALIQNMEHFYEISENKFIRSVPIVLLLNKVDLFREALKTNSLSVCFGDEYDESQRFPARNKQNAVYNVRLMRKLTELLQIDTECTDAGIPDDVFLIIGDYFNVYHCWLDWRVEDGIEFITQRYLAIAELQEDKNRPIWVHRTCAIEPQQIQSILNDVYSKLSPFNIV